MARTFPKGPSALIIEMAPMEGITNYLYRQAFARWFGGVDRYYTPFLSPNQHHSFQTKEWREIEPENNAGLQVIPQLLTNQSDHFLWASGEIASRGYQEVNFNLGCPSGTVYSKKKGSGLLAEPDMLDRLLDEIFSGNEKAASPLRISVKTRLGKEDPEEFVRILAIYNRYPLSELIIHPRVRTEFYKGEVHRELFAYAAENAAAPLSFNGNLFTAQDAEQVLQDFPTVRTIMLGRGMLSDPSLARRLRGGPGLTKEAFMGFHNELLEQNGAMLSGDAQLLHRMKELWPYWHLLFTNGRKYWKEVRKATRLSAYRDAAQRMFEKESLIEGAHFSEYIDR